MRVSCRFCCVIASEAYGPSAKNLGVGHRLVESHWNQWKREWSHFSLVA